MLSRSGGGRPMKFVLQVDKVISADHDVYPKCFRNTFNLAQIKAIKNLNLFH